MEFIRFAARGRLNVRPAIYPPEYVFRWGLGLPTAAHSSGVGVLFCRSRIAAAVGWLRVEVLLRTRRVLGLLERQLRSPGWSQLWWHWRCLIAVVAVATMVRASALRVLCACPAGARGAVVVAVVIVEAVVV